MALFICPQPRIAPLTLTKTKVNTNVSFSLPNDFTFHRINHTCSRSRFVKRTDWIEVLDEDVLMKSFRKNYHLHFSKQNPNGRKRSDPYIRRSDELQHRRGYSLLSMHEKRTAEGDVVFAGRWVRD